MQPSLALLTMLSGVSLIATLAFTIFRLHPSSFSLPARRPRLMKSGTCSNSARARTCSRSREALPHAAPSMQYSAPRLRPDSRLGMPKRLAKPVYLQSLSSLTVLVVSRCQVRHCSARAGHERSGSNVAHRPNAPSEVIARHLWAVGRQTTCSSSVIWFATPHLAAAPT